MVKKFFCQFVFLCVIFTGAFEGLIAQKKTHDPQVLQIHMHYGLHDEINTFTGLTKKDLIPGIAEANIWLTKREQEILEYKIEQVGFFNYPENIPTQEGSGVQPDMGDQFIRIRFKEKDKTVTWREPVSRAFKQIRLLMELRRLILDIVESKPEYKALPPRKGGYG